MLRRPQKPTQRDAKKGSAKPRIATPNGDAKQAAFVVFSSTIDLATMKKLEQHIIGIYTNAKEAEFLEKSFNEANEGERDGHFTKAYSVRYVLPYLAPMVKRALNL